MKVRTYGRTVRELRFLATGDDEAVVVSDPDSGEEFRLIVDDELSAAIRPDAPEPERNEQQPGGEDAVIELRPRDIQMRVRAGEDPQTLASDAGIPVEKVMRFAYPVLAERLRVVDEARRSRARGADGQTVGFGDLFDARVAALGTEPQNVAWDSFRRPDGGWTVSAVFTARTYGTEDTELAARFSLTLGTRTVSALNDTAADLLAGNPIKALQPPPPPEPEPEFGPPTLTAVPSTVDDDAEEDGELEDPAAADPVFATDPPREGEQRTSRLPLRLSSRRQKAHTHPIPVPLDEEMFEELFDQEALEPMEDNDWHEPPLPFELPNTAASDQPASETSKPSKPSKAPEAAPAEDEAEAPADSDERPDDRPAVTSAPEPAAAEPQPRRARAGDKPRMPSWDDILLGVRRKSE